MTGVQTCALPICGLHVCDLAEALSLRKAIVPVHGGVLSALGMLVAPRGREYSHSVNCVLSSMDAGEISQRIDLMVQQGEQALAKEFVSASELITSASLDLCYQGQSSSLNIEWKRIDEAMENFHVAHQKRYGHRLDLPIELVTIRVRLRGESASLNLIENTHQDFSAPKQVRLHGIEQLVPVYKREQLVVGEILQGPALITEKVSTTWLAQGWQVYLHQSGSLLLEKN